MESDLRRKIYSQVSQHVDIGDYDNFSKAMDDPARRKNFHTAVSDYVDMGDFDKFDTAIKNDPQVKFWNNFNKSVMGTDLQESGNTPEGLKSWADYGSKVEDEKKAAADKQTPWMDALTAKSNREQFAKGYEQMDKPGLGNKLAGGLNEIMAGVNLVGYPFGLADQTIRKFPGGERAADWLGAPFKFVGETIENTPGAITELLDETGIKSKLRDLFPNLRIDPKTAAAITEPIKQATALGGQIILGKGMDMAYEGIKEKAGIPENLKAMMKESSDAGARLQMPGRADFGKWNAPDNPPTPKPAAVPLGEARQLKQSSDFHVNPDGTVSRGIDELKDLKSEREGLVNELHILRSKLNLSENAATQKKLQGFIDDRMDRINTIDKTISPGKKTSPITSLDNSVAKPVTDHLTGEARQLKQSSDFHVNPDGTVSRGIDDLKDLKSEREGIVNELHILRSKLNVAEDPKIQKRLQGFIDDRIDRVKTIDDKISPGKKTAPTTSYDNTTAKPVEDHLTGEDIQNLPPAIADKMKGTADNLQSELNNASVDRSGSFGTYENNGEGNTTTRSQKGFTINYFPKWFSDLGRGKEDVIAALQKIKEDAGKDRGKLVEDLKAEILERLKGNHEDVLRMNVGGVDHTENMGKIPGDSEVQEFIEGIDKNLTLQQLHDQYQSFEDAAKFDPKDLEKGVPETQKTSVNAPGEAGTPEPVQSSEQGKISSPALKAAKPDLTESTTEKVPIRTKARASRNADLPLESIKKPADETPKTTNEPAKEANTTEKPPHLYRKVLDEYSKGGTLNSADLGDYANKNLPTTELFKRLDQLGLTDQVKDFQKKLNSTENPDVQSKGEDYERIARITLKEAENLVKEPQRPEKLNIRGMGAASDEAFGEPTSIDDLTKRIKVVDNKSNQVPGFFGRLTENQNMQTYSRTKSKIARGYENLKGASQAVWSVLSQPPKFDTYDKMYGEMDAALQKVSWQGRKFSYDITEKFPKLTREAMVNYIQAGGDVEQLKKWAKESKPEYVDGYRAALKLTDDEKVFADNISSYYAAKLKQGMDAGILNSAVENYLTGIWDKPNDASNKLMADLAAGKLPQNFKAAMKKIFSNYYEGEKAGFTPKIKDVGGLTAIYDHAFNKVLLARAFVKSLHDGTAADGRPFVEMSGARTELPKGEVPKEATLIKPTFKPKNIKVGKGIDRKEIDISDYKVINHPSLRDWKWGATDKEGNPVFYQADALVHPEIYNRLNNQLKTSFFKNNMFTRGLMKGQSELKGTKLSVSAFHQVQEGIHAIFHRTNPFNPADVDLNDPKQYKLASHGMQLDDFRAMQEWTDGVSGGGLLSRVPGLGQVLQKYNNYLFREYIPGLKVSMGLHALDRNFKRYGSDLTEDQIYKMTANQVNAAFGEQDYKAMGRNPSVQDFLRITTLAPDFLESRMRFVGQALTKYGTEQRVALGLMGVTLYVGSRALNMALDGKPHMELPFEVVYDKKKYGLRSIAGDVEHLIEDPRGFIYNRLSPLTKGITELYTGRDSRGIKQSSLETLEDLAKWLLPITVENLPGIPGKQLDRTPAESALQAVGIGSYSYTSTQQIAKKADDWLKSTNQESEFEKTGVYLPSDYKKLNMALQADDMDEAKKEYQTLLKGSSDVEAKSEKKILDYFKNYQKRSFTGSKKKEEDFKESLSDENKILYEDAMEEKQVVSKKFFDMIEKMKETPKDNSEKPKRRTYGSDSTSVSN